MNSDTTAEYHSGTDFGLSEKINLNIGTLLAFREKYKSDKMYFSFPFIPLAPLFAQNFNANTTFNRSKTEFNSGH
ncbi:MAG: hypothetical protein IPL53_22035 [Ignavibacteria bacterium]|nr:hypothetical protein [Ignavibacteria bacterium]